MNQNSSVFKMIVYEIDKGVRFQEEAALARTSSNNKLQTRPHVREGATK
jgi:hypothetical protein